MTPSSERARNSCRPQTASAAPAVPSWFCTTCGASLVAETGLTAMRMAVQREGRRLPAGLSGQGLRRVSGDEPGATGWRRTHHGGQMVHGATADPWQQVWARLRVPRSVFDRSRGGRAAWRPSNSRRKALGRRSLSRYGSALSREGGRTVQNEAITSPDSRHENHPSLRRRRAATSSFRMTS